MFSPTPQVYLVFLKLTNSTDSIAAFKKKYDREPDSVAMEGYDSVMMIAQAIEKSGSATPTDITQALAKTDWEGTRGKLVFPMTIVQIGPTISG